MLLFLYCIMCGVTFATTFLGIALLEEFIDVDAFGIVLPCALSAVFWPIGFPISIGMIAVAWIVRKYNCDK